MISFLKKYQEVAVASVFLIAALVVQHAFTFPDQKFVYIPLFVISYLFVGGPVWMKAWNSLQKGTLFSEFFLMGIATVGAFALGEYAEGVAVMLFYMIGEYAQHGAVTKARHSIQKLLDQQPDTATVERNGTTVMVHPSEVNVGDVIQVRPGEKVPLDGKLLSNKASFNTSALTGESKPMNRVSDEEIWAGFINQNSPVRIEVTSSFKDTKLSHILEMVQEASQRKAPTQRFMTRFAKIYTPIVVWLAVAVTFLPYLFVESYVFQEWFYKALVFLVVSCPCGLVISIPLGYFGGIGAASRNGILLKGSDYLDQLRKMDTLFIDKTGTLTEASFEVQEVITYNGISSDEIIGYAASLEQYSTHPIGKAILNFKNGQSLHEVENQQEISGKGLKGIIDQKEILIGNRELLAEHHVKILGTNYSEPYTFVHVAVGGEHVGTITISDRIKEDGKQAIDGLRQKGIQRLVMLSGDNPEVVSFVASELGIDEAYGGLLPGEKYSLVKEALGKGNTVGFMGDGVNDAPVITLADVGIAMGGIGSDATIDTADVVIQTDQPSKVAKAIDISRFTHKIVWQNIGFALGIKVLVMGLAAIGLASMWEAIFADVGVALIAIANAIRVQNRFSDDSSFFDLFRKGTKISEPQLAASSCCDAC